MNKEMKKKFGMPNKTIGVMKIAEAIMQYYLESNFST
jgi:hypothetical protein